MPSILEGAYIIIAFSFTVSALSLAVVIRYKKRTIPMNRFVFWAIFFFGIFTVMFYWSVIKVTSGVGSLEFVHASRVKQIYTLCVFMIIVVSALLVKRTNGTEIKQPSFDKPEKQNDQEGLNE